MIAASSFPFTEHARGSFVQAHVDQFRFIGLLEMSPLIDLVALEDDLRVLVVGRDGEIL
jgi:hypothetical protein